MNTSDLLDVIEKKVQDSSFDREEDFLRLLNDGLLFLAQTYRLPALQATDTVDTEADINYVEMPVDYFSNLYHVYNDTMKCPVRLCYTRQTLHRMFVNDFQAQGKVEAVCCEGRILHYRRVPKDPETLTLEYYTVPDILEDSEASVPDCIPEGLHSQLLLNFVLWKVFDSIEDGVEGQKINTQYYQQEFAGGIALLQVAIPDTAKPRLYFPRKARFF